MKIIITLNYICFIGGIETWLYNLVHQLYDKYDILILYEQADVAQLTRLSKYVNIDHIEKDNNYNCDICIIGSTVTPWYNNITANRYIQMVHCDFNKVGKQFYIKRNIPNLEFVTVSQIAKKSLNSIFGDKSTVIENPLDITRKPRRILKLISCTRLTEEKGYNRMKILAKTLKDNNIPFEWKIFTSLEYYNQDAIDYPEIIYMKPTLDVVDYIADSDYGVQLSDTESYGYFIHECLQYHTPVLVTDLPCLKDINFKDGNHGYILNFDMENLDVDKIYNNIPKCDIDIKEPDSINKWKKYLGDSNTPTVIKEQVSVEILVEYYDKYFNKKMKKGSIIKIPRFRVYELCKRNKFCRVIK